jgi:Putative lumazine-binding
MQENIEQTVNAYFDGVYRGDVAALAGLFDIDAQVYGDIDGQPYHKSASSYLAGVAARKSPHELGEPYRMQLLAMDKQDNIASVKLHSPMLGFDYYLYLSLRRRDGQWLIVNKTFSHGSAQEKTTQERP